MDIYSNLRDARDNVRELRGQNLMNLYQPMPEAKTLNEIAQRERQAILDNRPDH